ncbi:phosphatidylinositol 4-phosphate 5-kinase-like protein 1 [Monodelphis domestica]|uniref:phosphatidylinositol 4-phosphate 5-kinase-like protein 1 n=1 Tax=Monodelphis domestica TaxID=13616 RepID=UPI0024E23D7C|nr:phosphatidylinositol 4-phosphate 5-kinase-like protein 1 [Monodelphis domestica]
MSSPRRQRSRGWGLWPRGGARSRRSRVAAAKKAATASGPMAETFPYHTAEGRNRRRLGWNHFTSAWSLARLAAKRFASGQPRSQVTQGGWSSSIPGRTSFRQFLWNLREKWKLLGLFEIDFNHKYYNLMCMIQMGLSNSSQVSVEQLFKEALKKADSIPVLHHYHEGFEMETFSAPVFTQFRLSLGLTENDYQNSLSETGPYLQFVSNSKSKAIFFLTQLFLNTTISQWPPKTSLRLNPYFHNLRLLLDVPNDLHILDGPDYRYFVGIIDFFTVYSFRKRIENLWKSLVYPDRTFSTVNPVEYAHRLCRWVNLHTH